MMRTYLCLLLFLLFSPVQAFSSVIKIPFQVRGKLIVFLASVNDQTGYFILDTGVEQLVLNNRYFDGFPTRRVILGVEGRPVPIEEGIFDVAIGDWFFPNAFARITDLRALEVYTGLPVLGSIGGKLFRNCELVIDYTFRELTLYPNGQDTELLSLHTDAEAVLAFRFKGGMPSIEANIGGRLFRFGLDTGASANVLDARHQHKSSITFSVLEERQVASFGSKTSARPAGQLMNLSLGNHLCSPMLTLLGWLGDMNQRCPGPRVVGLSFFVEIPGSD